MQKLAAMRFADIAKRANALPNAEGDQLSLKTPPESQQNGGGVDTNDTDNEDKIPDCQSNPKSVLKNPYFKPNLKNQYKRPEPKKMSGFTRMDRYKEYGTDSNVTLPLLGTDNSVESESSSDVTTTTKTSLTSNNNNIANGKPANNKLVKNLSPFMMPTFGDANNNSQGILRGVAAANGRRPGIVVDPLQQINIRSKLKTKLRKIVDERLTIRQIFQRYVESSTLHGFVYTCSDTFFIRRFIWACLMILGAIYFLVKLKEGIVEYFDYPFSTLSTMDFLDKVEFPAISFCLINSYKLNALKESKFKTLYNQGRFPLSHEWFNPKNDISGDEMVAEIRNVSFSIDDIFRECDWKGRDTNNPFVLKNPCGTSNYTTYFNEDGQMCFTLNSIKANPVALSVDHAGMRDGYELEFDLKTNDAFLTQPYIGLKVVLHERHEPPNMDTGFVLAPGFKHFLKLKMLETINLPPPYGTECGEIELKYFDQYNQKACVLERLTDYVGRKCGCREPFMADNNLTFCSLKETIQCSFQARDTFDKHEERKNCPVDCEQTSFLYEKTEARYLHNPPIGLQVELHHHGDGQENYTTHRVELAKSLSQDELDHYFQDNMVKILFFYGEMSKDVHEQEATFDFYQFLGDMGGEIGLMLGASLLTFVEFVDLILFLMYHQILRLYNRKKVDDLFEDADEEKEV